MRSLPVYIMFTCIFTALDCIDYREMSQRDYIWYMNESVWQVKIHLGVMGRTEGESERKDKLRSRVIKMNERNVIE